MFRITKTVYTANGEDTAEMMLSEDNKVHFRQYFATKGFTSLEFDSIKELLAFLDKHFDGPKMFVCNNEVAYPLSEGDRTLTYFGTIEDI